MISSEERKDIGSREKKEERRTRENTLRVIPLTVIISGRSTNAKVSPS